MKLRLYARACALLAVALFLGACNKPSDDTENVIRGTDESAFAPVTGERITNSQTNQKEWLTYGGTYQEQRFSTLDQINEAFDSLAQGSVVRQIVSFA